MSRLVVRRARGSSSLLGPVLAGLGLGACAGFILGALYGPAAERVLGGALATGEPTMAELVHDALAALAADPALADLGLEVLPVSRGTIELHGWVDSRAVRTRAHRAIREALDGGTIVNCLLVRGEDDAGPPTLDVLSA